MTTGRDTIHRHEGAPSSGVPVRRRQGEPRAPVPRLALTRREAAESLGMGVTSFEQYVQPHIRAIRRGKLRLFPVSELARWLDEHAAMVFDNPR